MTTKFGKYKLLGELGRGGMGTVYRAEDTTLKRQVALKVLPTKDCKDEVTVQRFVREARAMAQLKHPNLAAVYDVGSVGERYYFTMELVDGEPLSEVIHREGRLDWKRTVHITRQVLTGLKESHNAGLVHRDIKPGNIMLSANGRVLLMDFGLAKRQGESSLTEDGIILGTPDYMSPEQAKGQDLDLRADLYSIGVVLFHMLSGRVPFVGKSSIKVLERHVHDPIPDLSGLVHDLPEGLSSVVARLMSKSPEDRHQSADEILTALEPFAPDAPPITQPVTKSEQPTFIEDSLAETEVATANAIAPVADSQSHSSSSDTGSRQSMLLMFLIGAGGCALLILMLLIAGRLFKNGTPATPTDVTASPDRISVPTDLDSAETSIAPPRRKKGISPVQVEFIDGRILKADLLSIDRNGNATLAIKAENGREVQSVPLTEIKRIRARSRPRE